MRRTSQVRCCILATKRANPSALEAQIDSSVYELYGLTEEEIAIVEGREGT